MENQSKMVGVRSGGEEKGERRGWRPWEETQPRRGAERSLGSAAPWAADGPGPSCRAEPRDDVPAGDPAALSALLSLPGASRANAEGCRLSSARGPWVLAWGGWEPAHAPPAQLCVPLLPPGGAWALTQEGGEGLADLPPALGVLGGGDQQGLGGARPVEVGPAAGEGDAVVGGVDHQRAVVEAGTPQLLQDQPDPWGWRGRAEGGVLEGSQCSPAPAWPPRLLPWSMRPMVVYWAARSSRAAGVSGTKWGT